MRAKQGRTLCLVSSMPLKGTREARGKPPKGGAWLRDHMVSSNEAELTSGKSGPCLKILPDGTAGVWKVCGNFTGHSRTV